MTFDRYLLHISYFTVFLALVLRDILYLRAILILAQSLMISYAAIKGIPEILYWNSLFLCINLVRLVMIIKERRPVKIPSEIEDIYKQTFFAMNEREFMLFWNYGKELKVTDGKEFVHEGEIQSELVIILTGEMKAVKGRTEIERLGRGEVIGENSYIAGKPCYADIFASGEVTVIAWHSRKLAQFRDLHPDIMLKLSESLGKRIAEKSPQFKNKKSVQVLTKNIVEMMKKLDF